MTNRLFITHKHIGKTYSVNGKQFCVCPSDNLGNVVLVNKREITVEVLVLGDDRCLKRDKSKPKEHHYLYEKDPILYSSLNEDHKPIFKHYSQFFK